MNSLRSSWRQTEREDGQIHRSEDSSGAAAENVTRNGGGRIQRPGVFLNAVQELVRAIICSHTFVIFLPQFRLGGSN